MIRVCGVSMDAPLHKGSNGTIGSRVRPRRPEISSSSYGGGPIGPHTANEEPVKKNLYKWLVPVYIFPEMKLLFPKQN
jgi:hypothetical protein